MSHKLMFWKTKIFTEEVTQGFPAESVHKALTILLRGTDEHSSEYINQYFEHIVLNCLHINDEQINKKAPEYRKKLNYVLFDPQKTTFFMMDQQVWNVIQNIVESSIKQIINDDNEGLEDRLKRIARIGKDYEYLSSLFEKKMLFVNIF